MPTDATFESFEKELNRLVESFGQRLNELKRPGYAEAAGLDAQAARGHVGGGKGRAAKRRHRHGSTD